MVWSKMKQNLESFLCPELAGKVEYRATGYRYLPDKIGRNNITVDKKETFNMKDITTGIQWYQTEQEIKNDSSLTIAVTQDEIETLRKETLGKVPEERLYIMARKRKIDLYSKEIMEAQIALCKSDFYTIANTFLSTSIEDSLESKDIILNVFALIDRRVGKKRIFNLEEKMKYKHPVVRYFYELRRRSMG